MNSNALYVTKRDLKGYKRNYDLYSSRIVTGKRDSAEEYEVYKDFSCQIDRKRDNVFCTCKRANHRSLRYHMSPRQIYRAQERYPGWKSFTEIGVSTVKTLPKRRTRRIYLPETNDRGVGNSDYTLLSEQKKRCYETSYYDQKRTSSKCVGGVIEPINTSLISKKLSPIVQRTSCATSPIDLTSKLGKNTDTYKANKKFVAQIEYSLKRDSKTKHTDKEQKNVTKETDEDKGIKAVHQTKLKSVHTCTEKVDKEFSSDSLVQHVHNLENPSYDKQMRSSIDPMENKLEREYRKIFTTKGNVSLTKQSIDKPSSDLKSASILRRRFEALRKGLSKKEDVNKDIVMDKDSSQKSVQSRKDVSIASDPPSLEPKSYSNTKIYSPYTSFTHPYKYENSHFVTKEISPGRKHEISSNWSTDDIDSDCQNVKGMFKLWGKKFNFEEDNYKKSTPKTSIYTTKQPEKIVPELVVEKKKCGKRFFFFKKRSKDKTKQIFKTKKGVTAGRCEVEDGLMIKIGAKEYPTEAIQPEVCVNSNFVNYDNILRKSWVRTFLTSKIDSKRSVQIRWNNNMYSTSSSTVFELLDCVYKNTGLVIRSQSDVTTGESSNYYNNAQNKYGIKYMPRNLEAWMIPKTIYPQYQTVDVIKNRREDINQNIQVTYSDRKWYVDKSHCGNKIELVLHSKNFIKTGINKSSEYILIDIPRGYFSESLTLKNDQSSDEEVYKITDYESPNSNSNLCQGNKDNLDEGYHVSNDVQDAVSIKDVVNASSKMIETVIESLPLHRDVTVQGSQVCCPQYCDVIGVGIITQRDIRDIKKPILKIHDDVIDSESAPKLLPLKKCEFAESYLQDYYRHWIPLGIDLYSWCVSDSQLPCSSENISTTSFNNQGDGSKSCPNICDDYQTSNIVSSCDTSSCSHCFAFDDGKKQKKSKKEKSGFLHKFFKKSYVVTTGGIRVLPKDSLEVFKKRKLYTCGNKSNWNSCAEPCSVPSSEDKSAQPSSKDCYKYSSKTKKSAKKHVSIPDSELMNFKQRSSVKVITSGCEACKKSSACQPSLPPCRTPLKFPTPCPTSPLTPAQCPSPPSVLSLRNPSPPPCLPPPSKSTSSKSSPCRTLPCKSPSCLSLPYIPSHSKHQPCKTPSAVCKNSSHLSCVSQRTSPLNPSTCLSPPNSPPDMIPPDDRRPQSLPTTPCKCCSQETRCCSLNSNQKSGLKLHMSPLSNTLHKFHKNSPSLQKSKEKECSPNCANRTKLNQMMYPPPASPPTLTSDSHPQKPPGSIPETFLKQISSKKRTCHENCLSDASSIIPNIIRLNSKENLTINLKKQTPSTEEIREGLNIKVQDEDGRTLYERVDYRKYSDKSETGIGPDNAIIKKMYRDSHIHRVSTTTCVNELLVDNKNSENSQSSSLCNLIEINFTLKLKNGDKTDEININDFCEKTKEEQATESRLDMLKDVYVVQDNKKKSVQNTRKDKNDVNITIFIKNYKQNDRKKTTRVLVPCTVQTDEFSKKISQKFHSVATGYSEFNVDNQAFSIHTTATGINNSLKKIKSNRNQSKHLLSEDLLKSNEFILSESSQSSAEHTLTDNTISSIKDDMDCENKTDISEKCSKDDSFKNIIESTTDKSETGASITDEEKSLENNSNKEQILRAIKKLRSRKEKKEILKTIFEKASSVKTKNKEAVKHIREMLHAVLTSDSSGQEDHSDTGNELIKELTYASLKPNYFKDTDSLNNYYNLDSCISEETFHTDNEEAVFPTKQNSSKYSDVDENTVEKPRTCMCSTLAARLNMKTLEPSPCCCRARDKKEEETHCDLIKETSKPSVKKYCAGVQADYYKNSFKHTFIATNVSTLVKIKSKESKKERRQYHIDEIAPHSIETCMMQKLSKRTSVHISDDEDKLYLNKLSNKVAVKKSKRYESDELSDVLQSKEMKKAVLEIYAEKMLSREAHTVARLPKYFIGRESKIYDVIEVSKERVCKKTLSLKSGDDC